MACFRLTVPMAIIGVVPFLTGHVFATELYDATKAKAVARVQTLLDSGADPNHRSPYDGPLHVAARLGPPELVITLLDGGADIELKGYGGTHPLHAAVLAGQKGIAAMLLARGAKVDALDNVGRTPLISLISSAPDDIGSLKILLAAGADPNLVDGASHLYALDYAAMQGRVDVTALLVSAGADVNAKDPLYGKSPLHYAMDCHTQRGTHDVVQYLIDHGADVNARDRNGMTPLDYAKQYSPNNGLLHQILHAATAH
jgi:ankyrin repeat protein